MARPPKRGLAYFPMDVDFFQDPKIANLLIQHGPLGVTTYIALLTMIYREGYYINLSVTDAAINVIRQVGESWYRKNGMSAIDLASKIILTCAEIGLLDESLVRQKVMTAVGIQRRYAAATARNKVKINEYRLLDEIGNPTVLESAPMPRVSATETRVFAAETPVFAAEMPQSKEKKIKENIYSRQGEVSATETGQDDDLSTNKSTGFSTGTSPIEPVDPETFKSWFKADTGMGSNSDVRASDKPRRNPTPAEDMADKVGQLFRQLLPSLPYAGVPDKLVVDIARAGKPLDYYRQVFERAAKSSFLSAPEAGRTWCCSLSWLCRPDVCEQVLAGKYDDFSKAQKPSPQPEQGVTMVNGAENGFETSPMFEAALQRGMKMMTVVAQKPRGDAQGHENGGEG